MRSIHVAPARRSGNALAPRVRSWKRSAHAVVVDRAATDRVSSTVKQRGDPASR
jgi:hypothetical protein